MRIAVRVLVAMLLATTAAPAIAASPPIFRFESEEFWLNLHTFLYVLGRAENKFPDAAREAVAGAPADALRGLQTLNDAERKAWADAVTAYAHGGSRSDPVFERDAALLESRLADADDVPTLNRTDVDPAVRDVLERVAPIYRRACHACRRREIGGARGADHVGAARAVHGDAIALINP